MISVTEEAVSFDSQCYCIGSNKNWHFIKDKTYINIIDSATGSGTSYCKKCAFDLAEKLVSITKYKAFI